MHRLAKTSHDTAGEESAADVSHTAMVSHKAADKAVTNGDTPPRYPLAPHVLERFVFLVGTPRSGTTIITRSFYLSQRVFACPNPTRFTHRVWRHRNKVDARLLSDIFRIPKFYRERTGLRTLDPASRSRVERQIREAFASKHLGRLYQLYPLIYSLDPTCDGHPERALCWADKGNDVYGLFEIARYMPKGKFIFIIRDPRAVVASMKSQSVRSRGEEGSSQASLAALVASCLHWRHMMQTFLRLDRRYPGRAIFIRYEDFVREPEETINRALEFATGETMPVAALQTGLSQFRHKRKHERKHGRSVQDFGIDRQPLERWRRMLKGEEIELVTALTWRTGRKLGYVIDPPLRHLFVFTVLARLKGWRRRGDSYARLGYLALMEYVTPWRDESAGSSATSSLGDNA